MTRTFTGDGSYNQVCYVQMELKNPSKEYEDLKRKYLVEVDRYNYYPLDFNDPSIEAEDLWKIYGKTVTNCKEYNLVFQTTAL